MIETIGIADVQSGDGLRLCTEGRKAVLRRIEREELGRISLKTEGLWRRRSSLEPAVWKVAHAILVQAIHDTHSAENSKRISKWKADAVEWFQSEQDDAGSFVWVCGILGLDPGRTRTAAKSARIAQRRVKAVH